MLIELQDVARYDQMGDERIAALDGVSFAIEAFAAVLALDRPADPARMRPGPDRGRAARLDPIEALHAE
jgi:hypothetical protein